MRRSLELDPGLPIPPGFRRWLRRLTAAPYPLAIVSPQNGRPDAFSYSLPGNIRGGTLRFFTPEKTLATFNVDFDQRTMTRIDDEALSKNEGGSAAGR